jgi:hypothetical protein
VRGYKHRNLYSRCRFVEQQSYVPSGKSTLCRYNKRFAFVTEKNTYSYSSFFRADATSRAKSNLTHRAALPQEKLIFGEHRPQLYPRRTRLRHLLASPPKKKLLPFPFRGPCSSSPTAHLPPHRDSPKP